MLNMEIVRCRCCLSPKPEVHYPLLSILADLPGGDIQSILQTLQIVTSADIVVLDNLPNEICQPCLLDLKVSYKFIFTFNKSQILLKDLQKQVYSKVEKNAENYYNINSLVEKESETKFEGSLLDHNYHIIQIKDSLVEDTIECKNMPETTDLRVLTREDILNEEKPNKIYKEKEIIIMTPEDVLKENKRKLRNTETLRKCSKSREKKCEEELGAYKCDICGLIYQSTHRLNCHKNSMHNANWMENFKCLICGKLCDTRSKLIHHKKSKHNDERFTCYLCGKVYRIKHQLRVHIQSRHDKHNQNKYLCSQCGRSFRSSTSLQYHLKLHDNIRDYMCRYCGFRSASTAGVKRHERTHTGEKPFLCRFCPKKFSARGDLYKHEYIHTGVRPYKCSYCPKTFTQTYNKQVHMMQHSGDFCCEMCHRKFISQDVLKFHYRVKHRIVFKDNDVADDLDSGDKIAM